MTFRKTPAANSQYHLVGQAKPGVVVYLRPTSAANAQKLAVVPAYQARGDRVLKAA